MGLQIASLWLWLLAHGGFAFLFLGQCCLSLFGLPLACYSSSIQYSIPWQSRRLSGSQEIWSGLSVGRLHGRPNRLGQSLLGFRAKYYLL